DFLTVNTDYSARMIQVSSLINNGKKFPNYIVEDSGRWKENGSHRADRLARNAARTNLDAEPRSLLENLAVVYSLSDAYIADQQAAARAGNSSSDTGGSGPAPSVMDFVPMRSICELEERLAESPAYKDKCFMFASYTRCKPALSLPNLAASLANLTSCRQLRPRQVAKFVELLTDCASYLDGNSTGRWQPTPARCQPWQLEAAYRLNLPINAASSHKIVQSVFQFPNNRYEVFAELERLQKQPQHHSIRVAGIYISPTAELQLYGEIVLSSLSWLSLAILGIALITWVYTESALLVAATLSVILCSLALAYAVCTVVSGSNSFSMLNSMAVVLAVGIGSDDVFVIASAWRHAKKKLLSDTLQHAGLSVTVTSLTTIAAFATNIISPIVAINSFAIYASLTVGFNLFFMLTVVPAVIVVAEQTCRAPAAVCDRLRRPLAGGGFLAAITAGCVRLLSLVAIRLRYLVHLGVVGVIIFCFLSVAYYPGLRFPRSNRRSLFTPDNPVEGYHARYAK
uniref:SSD domain-containing protein n=1 Tax=Macrostomum lignano TaxID=282301 RepID=A0A1I8HSI2_9PLAT